jgi:FkbM family methyltransferase
MKYNNRAEVEKIGRAGTYFFKENNYIVARQLSSYWVCVEPLDKGYTPHAQRDGFWEAWITTWMIRNVTPGSVCIDIGANFGYYTFFLAQHGCKVYGFEPIPRCVELLNRSNELNGSSDRVIIEQYAVTDSAQPTVRLWKVATELMNTSINKATQPNAEFFDVKATSLDKYFSRKTEVKRNISFIKIDAEGSEPLIWKGMQKLLKENPKCVVLMEFFPDQYELKGKSFFNELLEIHKISFVDFAGNEQSINDYSFFEKDKEPFRMIVLRTKEQ